MSGGSKALRGAHLVLESSNRKLGPVGWEPTQTGRPRVVPMPPYCASTTTAIAATCPVDCTFLGNGCYEQEGLQARRQALLTREAGSGLDVIQAECELIKTASVPPGRALRIHQGGDVSCARGALLLAGAARSWAARGGGRVWVYTHRWREIPGRVWAPIVAFASIEDPRDAREAVAKGYRPSLVLQTFPDGHRAFRAGGVTFTPCPFQTRPGEGITCVSCRLCLGTLPEGTGIAFAEH